MNSPQNFHPKLIRKEQLTDDTWAFHFEKATGFDYLPGQYVKIILNHNNPDERGISRFFTMSSSPTEEDILITTRILHSSLKKAFYGLSVGAEVQMRGPHGTFVLNEKDVKGKVYLAGGIGITPARSMLVYLRDKNLNNPFTLISSFSNREEIIFLDELNSISSEFRKVIYVVTSEVGRIDEEKIKKNVQYLNSLFYISGPLLFVEAMEKLVRGLGVLEEDIKSEDFPGY